LLGFGAIAVLGSEPTVRDAVQKGSSNMVALYVANALGGPVLFGFISAVAFSTVLAVVSGLTIAGASAFSHDLYAAVWRGGQAKEKDEMLVLKLATCALGAVSVALGLLFEHQNIAYMVGLTFAIAASANFPIILMSLLWKGTTTRGALAGGLVGLLSSVCSGRPKPWSMDLSIGLAARSLSSGKSCDSFLSCAIANDVDCLSA
jgi:cation/acetate symporter